MSDASDQANDQARFAAREFVARFARETGCELSAVITDRMLFAFEIGYMQGRTEGVRATYEEVIQKLKDTAEQG